MVTLTCVSSLAAAHIMMVNPSGNGGGDMHICELLILATLSGHITIIFMARTRSIRYNIFKLEPQWSEAVALTFHSDSRKLDTEPSIGASYRTSVHLATQFQRRRLPSNRPTRNNNCLWWPYLLTDRDEMNNIFRGLSMNMFYKVSIHLAKRWLS